MILNKKNEQRFYELAIEEIMTGTKRTGLWAMALSKSDGSLEKANALYIGLLAEEIKSDLYLEEIENAQPQKQLLLTEKVKKLEREKLDAEKTRLSNLVKKHQPHNKSIFDEQEKYQKELDKKIAEERQKELDKKTAEERQKELDKKTAEELKAAGVRLDPRFKHPQPYLKKY
ncbi:hypothetical protein [Myroides odoratimimus]|uniref:hypothetical protein n=1 Tax=Myroides odoratimimus TaxID=76832 RepID=UPI0025773848|nr:hypothetical protein [Myroides odoratimimus]MDM1465434.1 hypothetical protein [Myroides odoratimimus]